MTCSQQHQHHHMHCVCWRGTSQSSCGMIPTATDDAPWLTVPHWHDHMTVAVSTAHWSKTLLIPEEWLCGDVHCTQQKTGLVHSRSECWMRLVPMPLPFSTDAFQTQTMLSRSLQLSNGSDGHLLMMPSLKDSKGSRVSSQEEAASFHVVMTGWIHNQHHCRDMQMDCSTTRT